MKKLTLALLGIAGNVFALQPRLEIEYVNHAWGFDTKGCLVDYEGNVYQYGYGHSSNGKGLVPAGKMSEPDLKFASELAEKVLSHGRYEEKLVGADGGTMTWTAFTQYGAPVKLQARGDARGENTSPEAKELVKLMNGVCVVSPEEQN